MRLNQWDAALANRLVARLETTDEFPQITNLYIKSQGWGHRQPLHIAFGDANLSALAPEWSRVWFVNAVTGYNFIAADAHQRQMAIEYCDLNNHWPAIGSTTVENNLGIVCLD